MMLSITLKSAQVRFILSFSMLNVIMLSVVVLSVELLV
jgi:hypothetical protein